MVEYCQGEAFYASCPSGTTVLVTSALYGRMQLGRCVRRDYGYVGCQNDVTEIVNGRCSGQQSCEIDIPDGELEPNNPCPEDLRKYLAVSYTCEPSDTHGMTSSSARNGNYIIMYSLGSLCLFTHWTIHLTTHILI